MHAPGLVTPLGVCADIALPTDEVCSPHVCFEPANISISVPASELASTVDLMGQIQRDLSQRWSEAFEAAMLQEPPPAGSFRAWAPKGSGVLPVPSLAATEPQGFPYMDHNRIRFRLR